MKVKEYRFTMASGSEIVLTAKTKQEAMDKFKDYVKKYEIKDTAVTINESTRYNFF
ncbi:hypothetical protein [Eremococcus coleocola]|uniref:hypothetical protein n=1 Tax=Eremococcus coleocola TaxID=88132 RepID=UPI0003FD0472|nr:hypothetical protein [Eremococcus coleocola]